MKTLPHLLSATVLGAAFAIALNASAEDAQAIFEKFESQKAEALAAYLEANPEAEDADTAESMLVGAYMNTGASEKAAPLLRNRYDAMEKGGGANLQELIGGVVQPLFQIYSQSGQKDEAKAFVAQVKSDLATHPQGAQIGQFLDGLAGQLAMPGVGDSMDISFTAIDGTEIDTTQMKDKVVLVDFWATWCGPCVAEMPNVISAYNEYKDKGFEVIGISLDQDKGALEQFIEQRGMEWPQYFDGKGWENELSNEFGIRSIPATFLLGKDGKIVASNLRGDQLEQKLAELLSE